jgi:hypothetical protein
MAKIKEAPAEKPTTKAALIRQTRKELGRGAKPSDIVAALAAKGVEVSKQMIYNVFASSKTRRRQAAKRKAHIGDATVPVNSNGELNIEALVATKALGDKFGSLNAIEVAVRVLKRLQ